MEIEFPLSVCVSRISVGRAQSDVPTGPRSHRCTNVHLYVVGGTGCVDTEGGGGRGGGGATQGGVRNLSYEGFKSTCNLSGHLEIFTDYGPRDCFRRLNRQDPTLDL